MGADSTVCVKDRRRFPPAAVFLFLVCYTPKDHPFPAQDLLTPAGTGPQSKRQRLQHRGQKALATQ